jgi:hypothetical protein
MATIVDFEGVFAYWDDKEKIFFGHILEEFQEKYYKVEFEGAVNPEGLADATFGNPAYISGEVKDPRHEGEQRWTDPITGTPHPISQIIVNAQKTP